MIHKTTLAVACISGLLSNTASAQASPAQVESAMNLLAEYCQLDEKVTVNRSVGGVFEFIKNAIRGKAEVELVVEKEHVRGLINDINNEAYLKIANAERIQGCMDGFAHKLFNLILEIDTPEPVLATAPADKVEEPELVAAKGEIPTGTISTPTDGNKVGTDFIARGELTNITGDVRAWLVNKGGPRFWTYGLEEVTPFNNKWSVDVHEGGNDPEEKFYVQLILVSKETSEYIKQQNEVFASSNNWPGIPIDEIPHYLADSRTYIMSE